MIRAEEAIQLADSFKENYRKQERITLENNVSKWVVDAAMEGDYSCIVAADPKDSDYILEKLKENGFKCEVIPMGTQFGKENGVHIKVWWGKYEPIIDDCEHVKTVLQQRLVLNRG